MPTDILNALANPADQNSVLYIALLSALCSGLALIVSIFVPLFTQAAANKHALRMRRLDNWENGMRQAYEQFVSHIDIMPSDRMPTSSDVVMVCQDVARLLPYLDGDAYDAAYNVFDLVTRCDMTKDVLRDLPAQYTDLLLIVAKQVNKTVAKHTLWQRLNKSTR